MTVNLCVMLLIFNCVKYRDKAINQKKTWLKELPTTIPYYHVLGDPTLTTPYRFDDTERILYIQVDDDYNSLPKKVIRAYEAVSKVYNVDYIFKTDDDQHVTDVRFFNILTEILSESTASTYKRHYGGHIVNITQPHISQYYKIHPELPTNLLMQVTKYCSGRFYFLSKYAIGELLRVKQSIEAEYFEDYAIGLYLPQVLKDTILKLDTNKYFIDQSAVSDQPAVIS